MSLFDAAVDGAVTVVFCDLLDGGRRHCARCGVEGIYRDTVIGRVTDVPVVGHPVRLRVRVPRYRCTTTSCDREVFAHNTSGLARPGWSTTRRCARVTPSPTPLRARWTPPRRDPRRRARAARSHRHP